MTDRLRPLPRAAALVLIGFAVGRLFETGDARADVRPGPERQAFLAGGERSELVLKEIADTLKRIDGRLERIQSVAEGKPAGVPAARSDARGR